MQAEHRLQSRLRMFFDDYLTGGVEWVSIDHGVKLGGTPQQRANQWARMKARGIRPGVEDVQLLHKKDFFAIELKVGANGLSDAQRQRRDAVWANGQYYVVGRSVVAVFEYLELANVPFRRGALEAAQGHDRALAVEQSPKLKRPTKPRTTRPSRRALAFGAEVSKP